MDTFDVTITVTREHRVNIEAPGRHEAKKIAEKRWKRGEYVLGAGNGESAVFTASARNGKGRTET